MANLQEVSAGAEESLGAHLARLADKGWACQSSPGIWTDVCRAVERIALLNRARVAQDRLFALWVAEASRFGAVAACFPNSLRARAFVASFWHPAVFFGSPDGRESWYRDLPESPRTRAQLDSRVMHLLHYAPPAGLLKEVPDGSWHAGMVVDTGLPAFWSPELPEVYVDERGTWIPNPSGAQGVWR